MYSLSKHKSWEKRNVQNEFYKIIKRIIISNFFELKSD